MGQTAKRDVAVTRFGRIKHQMRGWVAVLMAMVTLAATPAMADTQEDVGVLAGMLQDVLSDAGRNVRIRGFQGALSSRATISEISISDDEGIWITLTDVVLDWNRSALLSGRVEINELSAERIDLFRVPGSTTPDPALPSSTAREDFSLPELPVSVNIGTVRAGLVHLAAPVIGQEAEFTLTGAAQLAGRQGNASFEAQRTDGQEGAFRFQGSFDNETRILTLDLSLTEGGDGIVATMLSIPDRPALGLSLQGEGPLNTFEADLALATDGQERVTGHVTVVDASPDTSVMDGGGFEVDITGDLRPLLAADLHPFFGARSALRATGTRSEEGELDLSELSVTTGAMQLNGSAAISPQGLPRRVQLTAGIERADGQPVLLPGSSGSAHLQRATLDIHYDEGISRDWTVRAEIDTLDLPTMMLGGATLDGRGRLNATSGTPLPGSDPVPMFEGVFEFDARGIEADDPAMQQAVGSEVFGLVSLNWLGAGQPVELTGLSFEGSTVSLTAYGELDGLNFTGYSELAIPDLAAFSALANRPLGGSALATVQGSANPLTGALDLTADLTTTDLSVDIAEADALLAGQSGISVSLRRDTQGTELRGFSVVAGTAEVTAQGRLDPTGTDLTASLIVRNLARLGEGYGGQLALESRLSTTSGTVRVRLDGSVENLALADLPAAGVLGGMFTGTNQLHADVVMQDGVTQIVDLTLIGPRLDLSADGRWSADAPDVAVTLNRLEMAALNAGGRGQISARAQLAGEDGTTRYLLSVLGSGPLATGIAQVDSLIGDGLTVQARATTTAEGGLRIDEAELASDGLQATISGLQQADGAARFAVNAVIDNIGRVVPGIGGRVTLDTTVTRTAGDTGYGVTAQLAGPSALNVRANGRVNDDFTVQLAMNGGLDSVLLNPSLEPASVSGLIRFDGTVNGPIGLNALRVTASLSDGRYSLPAVGVAFRNIDATAQVNGLSAQIDLSGTSLSGGDASISGRIRLDGAREADLAVRVNELIVQQPQLFEASISGAVRLIGPLARGPLVTGEVNVNQAEISIPNSPLGRAGMGLQGLVHVGEDAASRETRINAGIATGTRLGPAPVPMRLDLRLNAPGRVFVRGRGLDAELGGTLELGGTTRRVVPAGTFNLLRGRLDLLGNRFNLTDGSASMVGSFMPFIRLTATTESDGVLTSVTLSGQADSPEITFSSVPELPQDEVLARLIFRQALTSLSPFQAAQLAMSVATLTGRSDNSIISRTRQALGLDDLDFTVNDAGNTQLRAGRHIGERLYTDVSVDSTGEGEVTINLDLTSNITLRGRADSSGGSGLGIFFERDY